MHDELPAAGAADGGSATVVKTGSGALMMSELVAGSA